MAKKALIIGSEGQDGRLLSNLLLSRGYDVTGIGRSPVSSQPITYVSADISEYDNEIYKRVLDIVYDEIYYLAAFHHSSDQNTGNDLENLYEKSFAVNVHAFEKLLATIAARKLESRIFYASSSLIFSQSDTIIQTEESKPCPDCIYSITKNTAGQLAAFFRKHYGVFASVGILFNHESRLREDKFLSKKVINAAKRIKANGKGDFVIGDPQAQADWGYAPDFVEAMNAILGLAVPEDFIIATGELHTVEDWISAAFTKAGLDWQHHVMVDPTLITRKRKPLAGDNTKLQTLTGWKPKTSFNEMVSLMME